MAFKDKLALPALLAAGIVAAGLGIVSAPRTAEAAPLTMPAEAAAQPDTVQAVRYHRHYNRFNYRRHDVHRHHWHHRRHWHRRYR